MILLNKFISMRAIDKVWSEKTKDFKLQMKKLKDNSILQGDMVIELKKNLTKKG